MKRILLILVLTMLGIMTGASAQKNHKEYKVETNGYKWIKVYSTDFKTVGVEDTDGNTIIPLSEQFSMISFVQEGESGYFSVWKNDRNGAYTLKGVEMIPPAYDYLAYYGKEGFKYRSTNGKWYSLGVYLPDEKKSTTTVANNNTKTTNADNATHKNESDSVVEREQEPEVSEPAIANNPRTTTPQPTVENTYNTRATAIPSYTTSQDDFEPFWDAYDEVGYGFVMEDYCSLSFIFGVTYHFAKNVYATFGAGYMLLNSSTRERIYGSTMTVEGKASVIPIHAGLAFRAGSKDFSIDPFVGMAFNIGVSSKSEKYYAGEKETYKNEDFGGKLGVALKLGIRIKINDFFIMGRYNFPLNDNQEKLFTGPDSYPEIGIGYML